MSAHLCELVLPHGLAREVPELESIEVEVVELLPTGGQVTDVYGKELDFSLGRTLENNKGVIVSNGRLHDRVIGAVKDVLGL